MKMSYRHMDSTMTHCALTVLLSYLTVRNWISCPSVGLPFSVLTERKHHILTGSLFKKVPSKMSIISFVFYVNLLSLEF